MTILKVVIYLLRARSARIRGAEFDRFGYALDRKYSKWVKWKIGRISLIKWGSSFFFNRVNTINLR